MRDKTIAQHSVRGVLQNATRALHEELHDHPLLVRMLQPDLEYAELKANTAISLTVLNLVEAERQRLGRWDNLSLADAASKMARALHPCSLMNAVRYGPLNLSAAGLLGALYVTHGSAFGSAIISKQVKQIMPDVPQSFFLPRQPDAWHYLCELLENLCPAEVTQAEHGAVKTFQLFKSLADQGLLALTVATIPKPFFSTVRVTNASPTH